MSEIVSLCKGISCTLNGAEDLYDKLEEFIDKNNLGDKVSIFESCCKGMCEIGPNANLLNAKLRFNYLNNKETQEELLSNILKSIDIKKDHNI